MARRVTVTRIDPVLVASRHRNPRRPFNNLSPATFSGHRVARVILKKCDRSKPPPSPSKLLSLKVASVTKLIWEIGKPLDEEKSP